MSKFADGGFVSGYNSGDESLWMLHKGEYVIPMSAARRHLHILDAMNDKDDGHDK